MEFFQNFNKEILPGYKKTRANSKLAETIDIKAIGFAKEYFI